MARRRRRNPEHERSLVPDLDTSEFTEKIIPGAAAFAATRFIQRASYQIAERKAPKISKHVAIGASAAALGLAWAFGHKIKKIDQYYEPILIGAGAAAAVGLIQSYVPKYGWIVGDYLKEKKALPTNQAPQPSLADFLESDEFETVPLLPTAPSSAPQTPAYGSVPSVSDHDDFSDLGDFSEVNDPLFGDDD